MRELFLPVTRDTRHSYNQTADGQPRLHLPKPKAPAQEAVRPVVRREIQPLQKKEEKEAKAMALFYLRDLEQMVSLLQLRSHGNPLAKDPLLSGSIKDLEEGIALMRSLLFDKQQTDNPERIRLLRLMLKEGRE